MPVSERKSPRHGSAASSEAETQGTKREGRSHPSTSPLPPRAHHRRRPPWSSPPASTLPAALHRRCSLSLLLHRELSVSSPLCRRQIFVAACFFIRARPSCLTLTHASPLPSPRLASSLTLPALVTPDRVDHRCFSTPDPSVCALRSAGYKYLQCRASCLSRMGMPCPCSFLSGCVCPCHVACEDQ